MAALLALKPDILSFAFLSHKAYPHYAGSPIRKKFLTTAAAYCLT
jgi:hypothetical protein